MRACFSLPVCLCESLTHLYFQRTASTSSFLILHLGISTLQTLAPCRDVAKKRILLGFGQLSVPRCFPLNRQSLRFNEWLKFLLWQVWAIDYYQITFHWSSSWHKFILSPDHQTPSSVLMSQSQCSTLPFVTHMNSFSRENVLELHRWHITVLGLDIGKQLNTC